MKKNLIITILLVIVLCISGYLICDKLVLNKPIDEKVNGSNINNNKIDENNINENNANETETYKEYFKGQEISLSNGSKWLVIKDSDKNTDYVTLLSSEEFIVDDQSWYQRINNDFHNTSSFDYSKSNINKYLNEKKQLIPTKLKTVDGYDIRLITLDEIFAIDENWSYNSNSDSYEYTGKDLNEYFKKFIITMTPTKCSEGKCRPFYNTSVNIQTCQGCETHYYIEHWSLGIGGINPVINALKTSLD